MGKSQVVISLDFELHWGRFDKYSLDENIGYYRNTRKVIPQILDLFHRFEIKATWAAVGMLMADSPEEWEKYKPEILPQFENPNLSAYHWFKSKKSSFNEGLFAPELVRNILDTPGQELGSHSFSHFYTLEAGPTLHDWRADLKAAKTIAREKFGKDLKSLVFPRNQYSEASIQVAKEEGFEIFRTNPKDWFWAEVEKESLVKKIFRTGDTLFPLGKNVNYPSPKWEDGKFLIPASRLLRPYRKGSVFNKLRIARIKQELAQAINKNQVYHLWWHPHNFGNHPTENLQILEDLLFWMKPFMKEGSLVSQSMESLAYASEKLVKV